MPKFSSNRMSWSSLLWYTNKRCKYRHYKRKSMTYACALSNCRELFGPVHHFYVSCHFRILKRLNAVRKATKQPFIVLSSFYSSSITESSAIVTIEFLSAMKLYTRGQFIYPSISLSLSLLPPYYPSFYSSFTVSSSITESSAIVTTFWQQWS